MKKQFKTESKKLLDMMVNSIYTHKEIFLREIISNASDAIDKLYYRSLNDNTVGMSREDYYITVQPNKVLRTITVTDNGCGMTKEELETNLGTIAKSGSYDFKNNNEKQEDVDIIGQFGVGFYSAFMVADKITVKSRAYGADEAYCWQSSGADGYTVDECEKEGNGTEIVLHIKADTEDEKYSDFLEDYKIRNLIKKYSDYIRYPIKTLVTEHKLKEGSENEYEDVTEEKILNSMTPLWKKSSREITEEEYFGFYKDKFFDYEDPCKVIHTKSEGSATYDALLFIPSHAPYDYYTKEFERGLQLYSSGVMIMEKCKDLLPDYFGFVNGLVDSADLSLNISREMLQHDRQLKIIAKAIEKKIKTELEKLISSDREKYEKFFDAFGIQLKYGLYSDYGMHKETLRDLVMFKSSLEGKYVTLKEYVERMKEEQSVIYYACGETYDSISMLPQADAVKAKGYEILCLTEDVDEFALRMLDEYEGKKFSNICTDKLDISSDEEKEQIKAENDKSKELLDFLKEALDGAVEAVKFTNALKDHPVCLTSEGELSVEMEKVLNKMPGAEINGVKAQTVLEINVEHKIADKLKALYGNDNDTLAKYARVLYAQARLIGGLSIENPSEYAKTLCELL